MKKKIVKSVIFVAMLAALFLWATKVFTAKWTNNNCQSYTAAQLYELDKNSVEVAIGGSSQAVFGVSGMELYEKYGISSYDTGSPNQAMLCSLSWLKELNKTQNIKVAVLDVSQVFETVEESFWRQTLDTMHLSKNKYETVKQHVEQDENADSVLSYMVPLIKYHTRWNELTQEDFTFSTADSPMYRGNRMADYVYSFDSYDTLMMDESEFTEDDLSMVDYQVQALRDYVTYCNENNIELVLIKTPKEDWIDAKNQQVEALAKELGVTYINYASEEACTEMGINYYSDFKDPQHLDVRGADKLTDQLGAYLSQTFDLTDFRQTDPLDEQYLETYHKDRDQAYFLTDEKVAEYLQTLADDYLSTGDYDVIFSSSNNAISDQWTDEMQQALEACGIKTDLRNLGDQAYVATVVNGTVTEKTESSESMTVEGTFANGKTTYKVTSIPTLNMSVDASLSYNGVAKRYSAHGLNIFLYNNKTGEILDTPTVYICADGQLRLSRPIESKFQ